MNALLDAFAAAAPANTSLQLPGDLAADALSSWAESRGLVAEANLRTFSDGRRWTAVNVTLPNGAWIVAHRDFIAACATSDSTAVAS